MVEIAYKRRFYVIIFGDFLSFAECHSSFVVEDKIFIIFFSE